MSENLPSKQGNRLHIPSLSNPAFGACGARLVPMAENRYVKKGTKVSVTCGTCQVKVYG